MNRRIRENILLLISLLIIIESVFSFIGSESGIRDRINSYFDRQIQVLEVMGDVFADNGAADAVAAAFSQE